MWWERPSATRLQNAPSGRSVKDGPSNAASTCSGLCQSGAIASPSTRSTPSPGYWSPPRAVGRCRCGATGLSVEAVDQVRCHYSDVVDIEAGALTPVVAAFAALFYRYRQRRWRRLARILAAVEGSASAQGLRRRDGLRPTTDTPAAMAIDPGRPPVTGG